MSMYMPDSQKRDVPKNLSLQGYSPANQNSNIRLHDSNQIKNFMIQGISVGSSSSKKSSPIQQIQEQRQRRKFELAKERQKQDHLQLPRKPNHGLNNRGSPLLAHKLYVGFNRISPKVRAFTLNRPSVQVIRNIRNRLPFIAANQKAEKSSSSFKLSELIKVSEKVDRIAEEMKQIKNRVAPKKYNYQYLKKAEK